MNYPEGIPIFDVPFKKRQFLKGEVPEALPYDPEQAKLLLERAGWIDVNNNGVREKDDKEFRFTLCTLAQGAMEAVSIAEAVYIQDQLRRVEIQMEIRTFDRTVLKQKLFNDKDFDAAIGTWRWYELFEKIGKHDVTGYHNPEFFRLRDAAWETIDQDKLEEYL